MYGLAMRPLRSSQSAFAITFPLKALVTSHATQTER